MKLYYATTSPYARKVRVVAREKGLTGAIEEIACHPPDDPRELARANPLGKVPTLVLDQGGGGDGGGGGLYDSAVICEYLDRLGRGAALIPADGEARWATLKAQALADGILDLAVPLTHETRRPEGERSPAAMARWRRQIARGVAAMGGALAVLPAPGALDLGRIACGCALGYLDFRHPDIAWREGRPELAAWYATIAGRPSMAATRPGDSL